MMKEDVPASSGAVGASKQHGKGADIPPMAPRRAVRVQAGPARRASRRVRVARVALRAVFRLLFDVRVSGLEHVPDTPIIVCANHLGWADPFLILLFLPVEPRIYVLGERDGVLRNSFRVRMIDAFQIMVSLDRGNPRDALRTMEDVLDRGGSLLIFPEGRLGTQEGALHPLQPGAAHLSLRSGAALLPVGLTGTKELWLRRTLTLRVGAPITPASAPEAAMRARIQVLNDALAASLRLLLPGDHQRARFKLLRDPLTNLL